MNDIWGQGEIETKLDYVICWYKKALDYINTSSTNIEILFVRANPFQHFGRK